MIGVNVNTGDEYDPEDGSHVGAETKTRPEA